MGDEACGAKTESQTESGMEAELDMHEVMAVWMFPGVFSSWECRR